MFNEKSNKLRDKRILKQKLSKLLSDYMKSKEIDEFIKDLFYLVDHRFGIRTYAYIPEDIAKDYLCLVFDIIEIWHCPKTFTQYKKLQSIIWEES